MSDESRQAMRTFWSLADGGHEDQIYLQIGHMNLEKGSFDLAGKDRESNKTLKLKKSPSDRRAFFCLNI